MEVCGIVAEYNPFHAGHAHHLAETRRKLGGDACLVCVMSGNFVQRGEFALLDKYTRAEMAVRGGADLVIETPLAAALSSAEGFARGAVGVLDAFGFTALSFGCETPDADFIKAAALLDLLDCKPEKELSYAASRQKALRRVDKPAAALLDEPNNTLAVEYCRAVRGKPVRPVAVERRGTAHDADTPGEGFASASLLRAHMRADDLSFCRDYMPEDAYTLLAAANENGDAPVLTPDGTLLALARQALYAGRLRTGAADGFDERLQKAVYQAGTYEEAVSLAQTRRFPAARIRRALLRAVLGVPADADVSPQYLRVLAIGQNGRALLKTAKTSLPLLVKPVAEKRLPAPLQAALARDAFADDLFSLAKPDPARRAGGAHFRQTPFCLK